MIHCVPKGLLSWDYRVTRNNESAFLSFDFERANGNIQLSKDHNYIVKCHGERRDFWTLQQGSNLLYSAKKEPTFLHTFEVVGDREELILKARSAFKRGFDAYSGQHLVTTIDPKFVLSRKAVIHENKDEVSFLCASFLFWLAAFSWKKKK
ncbi:hypothetical protein [Pleionea sp. CnH1-48]|uniref:hypothetical protein n=1 Tax=Pleionea sp. CnH1-48 TaxID=2954494 RepID=UPI002098228C|nr:hypothetical protein [Pleionea sp. CnH1-48]MCO7223432.1 hypothetical protein [Pleionea sp. CnH1-48]